MSLFKPGDKVVFVYDYWTLFENYRVEGPLPEKGRVYCVAKVDLGLLRIGIALVGSSVFGTRFGTEVGFSELMFRKLEDVQKENIEINNLIMEARHLLDAME